MRKMITAASLIVSSCSNNSHLQKLTENIYDLTVKRSVNPNVVWIPREQNQYVNNLVKGCHYDDWENTDQLF